MPLTDEQKAIVETERSSFKVEAVAGSGKTTTLIEYARRRPDRRILYLAYNRTLAEEIRAKCRDLSHVKVSTIHALAYKMLQVHRRWKVCDELSEVELLERGFLPKGFSEDSLLSAWLLRSLLNFYLNSAIRPLTTPLLERYLKETEPTHKISELLNRRGDFFLAALKRLLTAMKGGEIPAVHDFYLKCFQLTRPRLPFDLILVDEAQDTSEVMLDLIQRQKASKIFVGDPLQQIYAFRHAVNALEKLELPVFSLSHSFRFGDNLAQQVARRTSRALTLLGRPREIQIRGQHGPTRLVRRVASPYTFISRTNLSLFEAALNHPKEAIFFEGGLGHYNFMSPRTVSLFHLARGQRHKVQDRLIASFKSPVEVLAFAEATRNMPLRNMVILVVRHGEKLFERYREIERRTVGSAEEADVLLTNVHQAKGKEYDAVDMGDDFLKLADIKEALHTAPFVSVREEIYLWYVAATRARSAIRLAL